MSDRRIVDAFRNELGAIETRTLRTEEERDEARREVAELKTKIEALRLKKTRKTTGVTAILMLFAFVGAGWLIAPLVRGPSRRDAAPEAPASAQPSGGSPVSSGAPRLVPVGPQRLQWRKLAVTCDGCTGLARSRGPMMLGKRGATFSLFQAGTPGEKMVRDDAPVPVDLFAGVTIDKPGAGGLAVVVGRAQRDGGWAAARHADNGKTKWTVERIKTIEEDLLAAVAMDEIVFAVGERGTIVRRDALGGWTKEPSGTGLTLRAVGVTHDKRPIAVGDGGVIVIRDELDPTVASKWHSVGSPSQSVLRTIVASGTSTWIAGDQGTVLGMLLDKVVSFWFKKDTPVPEASDFVSGATWNGGELVLATRHGEIVDLQPDGSFAVDRVTSSELDGGAGAGAGAGGDDVLGLVKTADDLVLVTMTGQLWISSRSPGR